MKRTTVKRHERSTKTGRTLVRRTFYRFGEYMHDIWGVKIERLKKEKGEMKLHYRPESNVAAERRG